MRIKVKSKLQLKSKKFNVLLIKKKISVIDLAKRVGITRQAVYLLRANINNARPEIAEKICETLNVEKKELFKLIY